MIKMKNKIIQVFVVVSFSAHVTAQDNNKALKVYEKLDYNGRTLIYNKSLPTNAPPDTIYFRDGVATYSQDKYTGDIAWLNITQVDRNMVHYMVLEPGTLTVTVTKDSMIFITGTPNNDAFFVLDQQIEPLRRKMKALQYEVAAMDKQGEKEKIKAKNEEITSIAKLWWQKQMDFAMTNKNLA